MPTTTTRILGMSTVLKTREVGLYLVYVTVFVTFRPLGGERSRERIREYGRNTTDGLAYNHPTRCRASCGDGTVVWSASRQPDPAP